MEGGPALQMALGRSMNKNIDMEATPSQGLYPLHRCKTIHLVRNAQGIHNLEGDKNFDAYLKISLMHILHLSDGNNLVLQVDNLRKHVKASGIFNRVELVVVSPLLRTLQTAVGNFGGEGYRNVVDAPLLMIAGAGNSKRPAIASLNSPPFIAVESCGKQLGVHPCDRRSNIIKYRKLFPAIDFSLKLTKMLWKPNVSEENKDIATRGMKFMNCLSSRKEKEIAVVTHCGFLYQTLNSFGNDCDPAMKIKISTPFANCELRSVVLVDKCMNNLDPQVTNYAGKLPGVEDLPSDIVQEK